MIKRIKINLLLSILILFISSCTSTFQSIIDDIDYEVVSIDINVVKNSKNILDSIMTGNLSRLAVANITPHIKLMNNNSIDLLIGKIEYTVFIDELMIAEGISDSSLELKSNETATLLLPINISLDEIAKNKMNILLNRDMDRIKVVGKNYVDTITGQFIVSFIVKNNKITIESIDKFLENKKEL